MKHIKISNIVTTAEKGSTIENCIKEGIELAAKEWQIVIVKHNSNIYTIDPEEIYNLIMTK